MVRQATWGVALIRYAASGEVQDVSLTGSGFFVSRNHFITAAHVIDTGKLLGRARSPRDEVRIFRTDPFDDQFHGPLRVAFESKTMDAAILESSQPVAQWLSISVVDPGEGEEVGLYGYPLAAWRNKSTPTAYALGTLGVVSGFGRDRGVKRIATTLVSNPGNSGGPVFLPNSGEAVAIHKGQLLNLDGEEIAGYSVGTLLSSMKPELQKVGVVLPTAPHKAR